MASLKELNQYIGGAYQVTRLVGGPTPGFPKAMNAPAIGDFSISNVATLPTFGNVAAYFQGVLNGERSAAGSASHRGLHQVAHQLNSGIDTRMTANQSCTRTIPAL